MSEYEGLYSPISSSMKPLYEDWESCLSEHLVRTVTSRIFLKLDREAEAAQQILAHTSQNFIYIKPLYDTLEEYEKKRTKYPTFEDFIPKINGTLKKLSSKTRTESSSAKMFNGPINSLSKNVKYIIIPTNEANDQVEEQIKKYAESVRDFLKKNNGFDRIILTDLEALDMDMTQENVFVYGTISGNLWLKNHAEDFPFSVEADKIIADKSYPGENLKLITAWPQFENKSKGIILYTAQRAEDIIGINSVFHGPNDFIIFESRDHVLVAGDYDKTASQWTFLKKK